jgi:hypothetical protein
MSTLTVKPTVYYRADRLHIIAVGYSAMVYPMAHPSELVTGDGETPARTSSVVRHDLDTGEFWTENTHYVPVQPS